MFNAMFSSPVWQLIVMADWISKWVVMFGLLIVSIICVAVIIFKAVTFYKQKALMNKLFKRLNNVNSFSDICSLSKEFTTSVGGQFIMAAEKKVYFILNGNRKHADASDIDGKILSKEELERLEFTLEQEVDRLVRQEEIYLPFLGTSAAVGPLMGLFGTICGLIYAFMSISQEKSADIATVAPGIASALMTTLAGLVVAIPAMIAFHYFSHELVKREHKLYEINDLFMIFVRNTFVK